MYRYIRKKCLQVLWNISFALFSIDAERNGIKVVENGAGVSFSGGSFDILGRCWKLPRVLFRTYKRERDTCAALVSLLVSLLVMCLCVFVIPSFTQRLHNKERERERKRLILSKTTLEGQRSSFAFVVVGVRYFPRPCEHQEHLAFIASLISDFLHQSPNRNSPDWVNNDF